MERAFQNDNVFKNVVQEISRECTARNIEVEESFVRHVTKLFALNIDMGISSDGAVERETLEFFVKHVVNKLAVPADESPQMATLKMQLHGATRCGPLEASLTEHNESIRNYLHPLTNEIIEEVFEESKEFIEKFRRKLAVHLLLESQMGHPSHLDVFNEGMAALHSVFSKEDLISFFQLPPEHKFQYLQELTHIISGIRLLNKHLGRSEGFGFTDIEGELKTTIEKSRGIINTYLTELQDILDTHTSAVIYCTEIDYRRLLVYFVIPQNLVFADIEDTRERLILQRQYEVFLNKLKARVEKISQNIEISRRRFRDNLKIVVDEVGNKNSLKASVVFPLFYNLATSWFELQDYLYLLLESDQSAADLKAFARSLVVKGDVLPKMLKDMPVLSHEDRMDMLSIRSVDQTDFKCKLLNYEDEVVKEGYKLKFNGFCIWYLVHCRGLLVKGVPEIALMKHHGELYAFSTAQAVEAFGRTPDRYLYSALDVIRGRPELVGLFEIEDIIFSMSDHALNICQELHPKPDRKEVKDVHIQTVTHLYEKKIDRKYKWNVWDMRREALQMANLSNCVSHGMQTIRTYQRFGVATQTAPPKNQCVQTTRDNYTNTPTPLNYKLGLRGRRDYVRPIVDMTRPAVEDYYTCTAYNILPFDEPFPKDPVPKCTKDNNQKFCQKKCWR